VVQQFRRLDVSQDEDIPKDYLCPITSELMEDPVVAADGKAFPLPPHSRLTVCAGHTYERRAIELWFEKHLTSPITNEPLRCVCACLLYLHV
jgi:hypothetical protein